LLDLQQALGMYGGTLRSVHWPVIARADGAPDSTVATHSCRLLNRYAGGKQFDVTRATYYYLEVRLGEQQQHTGQQQGQQRNRRQQQPPMCIGRPQKQQVNWPQQPIGKGKR